MTAPDPYHTQPEFTLHRGDCVEKMRGIPDASVDTVCVDGPYGIHFMGKAWDGQYITRIHEQNNQNGGHKSGGAQAAGRYNLTPRAMVAFQEFTHAWALEAFRILKPGGHLVSFCSTRTYHRMAAGVEDAGFEVRDQLAWVYGSGFPKSLDVGKAIDASDRIGTVRQRSLRFTEFMRSTGVTARQINEATDSCMASHYLTPREQPEVATEAMFAKLRPLIAANGHAIPDDVEQLVAWRTVESENMKRRKVLRTETMVDLTKSRPVSLAAQGLDSAGKREVDVTAAHTEDAKAWEGWGTALKPSWEPIVLARKPLDGTVADNVLRHGTGALNVDACRVAPGAGDGGETHADGGRWPANLVHDGSPGVVALFPADQGEGEPESASRFFYAAKADTRDREEGLAGFEKAKTMDLPDRDWATTANPYLTGGATQRANVHPTVKPTELMRWLLRLVTRKGGRVVDCFTGSGSTGKACVLEGLHFTGIDLDEEGEYLPIAKARILYALEHRDRWEAIHAAPAPAEDSPGQTLMAL